MFAPLTSSGVLSVDGTMVSNCATVGQLTIPHSAMHASFALCRMLPSVAATKVTQSETINTLAYIFYNILRLDKLL